MIVFFRKGSIDDDDVDGVVYDDDDSDDNDDGVVYNDGDDN